MKTRLGQVHYHIEGEDESGLIPNLAISAVVKYDINGPISIYFALKKVELPELKEDESGHEYMLRLRELDNERQRINTPKPRDEVIAIVNALEKALE